MAKRKKPVAEIAAEFGMTLITPHITCREAEKAIAFYGKAFGAEPVMPPMKGPDGRIMHATLRMFGGAVMVVDEYPEMDGHSPQALGGSPVTMHVMVEDVDAAFDRAVAAGAESVMAVADQFWGDRYGMIRDPFGHLWSLATPVYPPKSAEDINRDMAAAFSSQG